jgi:rubredoxin-NAD+ reductase
MNDTGIVVIGGGMAAYALAREFRKLEPETPFTIVSADDGAVYAKPMLSNALAQNKTADALVQKDAARAAQDLAITVRSQARVTRIGRDTRQIEIDSNGTSESMAYTRLVLATGATPRACPVAAHGVPVATVNSLDDYRRWRANLKDNDTVLLIGAGLIGTEFANDLASSGHAVVLTDPAPWPLSRLLPEPLGRLLSEALSCAGVEVICGHGVSALQSNGARATVMLDDGRRVGFDKALSAIGLVPNTGLAAAAGLSVDQGIVVDAYSRTDDPAIFALGDCAQTAVGLLPYVSPMLASARAMARTLAGNATPLHLPASPVVVKTPALPLVTCPPRPGAGGDWAVEGSGRDRRALFAAADGSLLGFALSGSMTRERLALSKRLPDLLPRDPGSKTNAA